MRRNNKYFEGEDFKNKLSRNIIPILIKRAEIGKPITYSQLAEQVGYGTPRIFGPVLGHIADTLERLGREYKIKIPPIQCIVIDKKNGMPGKGVAFLTDPQKFKTLSKEQKKNILELAILDMSSFKKWGYILDILDVKPIEDNFEEKLDKVKSKFQGKGESEQHKALKNYIAKNPQILGLKMKVLKTEIEYKLTSGDKIDIMLYCHNAMIGVEVKSYISNEEDVTRGIFQCIKYKAVLSAEQFLSEKQDVMCLLVCESRLNECNRQIANLLDVKVIEEIKTDRQQRFA